MKAVVIYHKDRSKLKQVTDLLKMLGIKTLSIDRNELEDLVLSRLLEKADRTKMVSKFEIMKKLRG